MDKTGEGIGQDDGALFVTVLKGTYHLYVSAISGWSKTSLPYLAHGSL